MERYINKSALEAEIRKRLLPVVRDKHYDEWEEGQDSERIAILDIIDTLEVKEEILDKEGKTDLMRKCVHKAYKRGYDMGVLQTTNKIKHNTKKVDLEKEFDNYAKDILACDVQFEPFTHLYKCAQYFYELGLNAKKEE